jgi:hypothetical protein
VILRDYLQHLTTFFNKGREYFIKVLESYGATLTFLTERQNILFSNFIDRYTTAIATYLDENEKSKNKSLPKYIKKFRINKNKY